MEPHTYRRIFPIPTLTMLPESPVLNVERIQLVQRQMSYGDSTTKRATVSINNGEAVVTASFGVPGTPFTLRNDVFIDALGRNDEGTPLELTLNTPLNISRLDYSVYEVYPFRPPTPAPRMYGGRAKSISFSGSGKYVVPSYVVETSLSSNTDSFYADGTADVGLVRMSFLDKDGLVPSYGVQAVFDNTSPSAVVADEDHPRNPFLNPYRTSACNMELTPTTLPATKASCNASAEDAYYIQATWPCNTTLDAAKIDCSLEGLPKSWSWPGYAVRSGMYGYQLLPHASAATFARLYPKPQWSATFDPPLAGVCHVGVRQRQMAFLDASAKRATLCVNGQDACFDVNFVEADGTVVRTNFTFPSPDVYGRAGWAAEALVSVGCRSLHSMTVTIEEVYDYEPPASLLAFDDATWSVTRLEVENDVFFDYVHPTNGTWNVGLTSVAFYDVSYTLLDQGTVNASATASSNGAFSAVNDDGVDVFHPQNALLGAYADHADSSMVPNSWCWPGWAVLRGLSPYVLVPEDAPPPPPDTPEAIGEPSR